jgi:hypothetical protein
MRDLPSHFVEINSVSDFKNMFYVWFLSKIESSPPYSTDLNTVPYKV